MSNLISIVDQRVILLVDRPIDLFKSQFGTVYWGFPSVRVALQEKDWASKVINYMTMKALTGDSDLVLIGYDIATCSQVIDRSMLLTGDEFKELIFDVASKKKVKASHKRTEVTCLKEQEIQEALQKRFGGSREVTCNYGRIDLLTKSMLIEVKSAPGWKSALGQLCAYGKCYPRHTKIMYLFDVPTKFNVEAVKEVASSFGVLVKLEGEQWNGRCQQKAYSVEGLQSSCP